MNPQPDKMSIRELRLLVPTGSPRKPTKGKGAKNRRADAKRRASMLARGPVNRLSDEEWERRFKALEDPEYYSRDTAGVMRSTLSGGTFTVLPASTKKASQP